MYSANTKEEMMAELADTSVKELRRDALHYFDEAARMMDTSYLLPAFGPARRALECLGELLCREFKDDGEAEWHRFLKALSRKT